VDLDFSKVALALKYDKVFSQTMMKFLAEEAELAELHWDR
jgi:hypothetical protein